MFRVANPSSGFKSENYLLKYCFCGPVGHVICSIVMLHKLKTKIEIENGSRTFNTLVMQVLYIKENVCFKS